METEAFLDTHVLLWLGEGETKLLSKKAKESIETCCLLVSPITLLELDFLHDIKKIILSRNELMELLEDVLDLEIANDPFVDIVNKATDLKWTRDPFDRLLTSHAILRHAHLVTKDRFLRKHYSKSVW